MELFGGIPGVERGGSDAEGLDGVEAAFAACGARAAGEREAEASFGEVIGFKEFGESGANQIDRRRGQIQGVAGTSETLPMAGNGVGLAVAGEEGFEDSVADEEAVVSGREPDFFDWDQSVVPPDDHGLKLAAIGGKPSGMRQKMRLRDIGTKLGD